MKPSFILLVLALFAVGCTSSPTAVPTLAPTEVPTAVPQPTAEPTNTPLPPTPTSAPSNTPLPPPTNTPIPLSPTPTATRTRPPVTALPTSSPTVAPTEVVLKYGAPVLIEPTAGDTRTTSNDLAFKWRPVAALGTDECYLVTVRITNTVDKQFGEQSFIAQDTCNDAGNAPVKFTLSKRQSAPDYFGLLAYANRNTPANSFIVTWNVMVVQDKGADPNKPDSTLYVPVSPPSETFTFNLQG